jgi:uncharacterized membrane protein (DUF485 family)
MIEPTSGAPVADGTTWRAIERSPAFAELVAARRRFVAPALAAFFGYSLAFLLLCGYAPRFMAGSLAGPFTVGMGLTALYLVLIWALSWAYLRRADRVWDPLADRIMAGQAVPPRSRETATAPALEDAR